jgi:hypothetical protein
MIEGTKGEKGDALLPGDIRLPWWKVIIPYVPGVLIKSMDILYDQFNQRFTVSSTELTELGWRLTAMEETS